MTPGTKLNIGLAVTLAVLVAVVMFTSRKVDDATLPLAELDPGSVQAIRIERPDKPPIVLARENGDWVMREPLTVAVEARRVTDLVESFNVPSHARYAIGEISPDLGLGAGDATPIARVTIDDTEFVIGKTAPITDWRYVRVGDEVHLVSDVVFHRIQGDAYSWVRRQPLPPGGRIARIELEEFTIVRAEPGWSLEPADEAVSADALQELVDAWANAQAFQVVRHEGGDEFDHTVRIVLDGGGPPLVFGLRIGEDATTLVRADLGLEYRVPAYDGGSMVTLDRD